MTKSTLVQYLEHDYLWLLPERTYHMDTEWITEYENPSRYKAFEWRETHLFRTPLHLFEVTVRQQTKATMLRNMVNRGNEHPGSKEYSVMIGVAEAGIPSTLEEWEHNGGPWKGEGGTVYMDCFYGGKKYKFDFPYDRDDDKPSEGRTESALSKGFDTLEEAYAFANEWKQKLLDDHKTEMDICREILELSQNLQQITV